MAATYGYSGDFSSDEEIDRIEQQSERLIQAKFDMYDRSKPTKDQISRAIEDIKNVQSENEYSISDELLGGILDSYQVSRGPIVDSTRNLYKKIALRMARGYSDSPNPTNGNANNNNNNNNNNNEDNGVITKKSTQDEEIMIHSSDEDEPMAPVSEQNENRRQKFDSRVVNALEGEPMEIDSEAFQNGQVRNNKQVDLSTDEDDEDDSETEESSEEDSESEEVDDVKPTPRKPAVRAVSSSKRTPSDSKKVSSPSETDTIKKPYTRSQRSAAVKAGPKGGAKNLVTDSKGRADTDVFVKSKSRSGLYTMIALAVVFVMIAFALFKYKATIMGATDGILSNKIKF